MKTLQSIILVFLSLSPVVYAESTVNGIRVLTRIEELVEPEHSAVIVIDMQNENVLSCGHYFADEPGWKRSNPIPDEPRISDHYQETHDIPQLARFINTARKAGVTIIYVEIVFLDYDQSGIDLMYRSEVVGEKTLARKWSMTCKELAPKKGDLMIYKHSGDSFSETQLDQLLRSRSIKSVILTGTATNGCVMGTTWGAELHGYYPVLVRDIVNHGNAEQRKNAQFGVDPETPPDKSVGAYYERALVFMESRYPVFQSDEIMKAWNIMIDDSSRKKH